MTGKVGSRQDGEAPEKRSDLMTERANPGRHGGAGSPGRSGRPKNREVEDEMVTPPGRDGEPPKPATQPDD